MIVEDAVFPLQFIFDTLLSDECSLSAAFFFLLFSPLLEIVKREVELVNGKDKERLKRTCP